ncbi:MAG TPA: type VI secretion system baseplate subunit TssF [Gemmataceae bacterium]|jgi:type VI secretion system protein ImpG
MSEELLPYYNRELSYIRRLAAQFADEHPKIARRLRLSADSCEDPHVERLIEGFAYLTARVRHKLDDEFPEITESLLGVLYPHYQAPLPSLAIVKLELDPEQTELTDGYPVARHTMLETDPIHGEPCRFRTCYPVTLWPIEVESAALSRPPFTAPLTPFSSQAAAVLRLTLRTRSQGVSFTALNLSSLRFFLKGQPQHVYRLYELLFNNTLGAALAVSPKAANPVLLDRRSLHPVGFERDEGLLPYTARSFVGYRLLSEYFAFPEKFLFADLEGLAGRLPAEVANNLEIFLYLDRTAPDLEPNLSADTFHLGCTPIVNLYTQRAEPIELTHADFEYRIVPDARRPLAHEIYTVDRVTAMGPDGHELEYRPFFSVKHADNSATETYWHSSRKPAERGDGQPDHGSEVFLSLVDLGMRPSTAGGWTLDVETTCLNRDLPHQLPFGPDQPRLQLSAGGGLVTRIVCLTPPTPTLRPAMKRGVLWRLISHLSLNHLSLTDNDEQAHALREILKLYDFTDSAETRQTIDGILSVRGRRVVGRVGGASFCRGVEVTLRFDEERFSGSGLFLFASVLERFLGLYCTVNSFSKLIALTKGGERELRRWLPRAGEKVLM